jgi:D-alanyl-D-alanine carboxypeptidase (penicillin-binding protein 5/6)
MKKIGVICLILCVIIGLCLPTTFAAADEVLNSSVLNGSHSLDASKPLLGSEKLVDNVRSAVIYETVSQTLMYSWNADEKVSPASFVKILTALLVAEQGNLTDAVTVKEMVLKTVPNNAVTVQLQANEVLTVEDLLYCMMVGSGNDAAAVLADHVCGSQAAFVAKMNQYAQKLGCNGTNFTNVHGLHDDNQYTTARDVAKILDAALKNEIFCDVFQAAKYTVPPTNKSGARSLVTGNYLMNQNQDSVEIYYDPRVTGGRTGVTSSDERCIAVTSVSNDMHLISIVTGSKSVYKEDGYTVQIFGGYKETSALLDAAFTGHKAVQVIHPNQSVIQCRVENGDSDVVLGTKEAIYTVLPQEIDSSKLTYRYTNIGTGFQAPIEKGQAISSLEIWNGNLCVGQVELFALNAVSVRQDMTGNQDDETDRPLWPLVMTVVVCCGIGIAIIVISVRTVTRLRYAAVRRRSRRYSRSRRRSR